MPNNKPGLVTLFSFYFFFLTGITLFLVILPSAYLFFRLGVNSSAVFILILFTCLTFLYFITGIGISKAAKWSRISSIIIFSLTIIGQISSLLQQSPNTNVSPAFKSGQMFGLIVTGSFSCLGLYAMLFNQSVKDYFEAK